MPTNKKQQNKTVTITTKQQDITNTWNYNKQKTMTTKKNYTKTRKTN